MCVCVWVWVLPALCFFLAWELGRVASCVCRIYFPPSSRGAACGVGVCGGCRGWGLSPPSPFVFFFGLRGGVWFSALPCRGFVVSTAACSGLGSLGLRPPFPCRLGCVHVFNFCPPLLQWAVSRRVRGVLSSARPLLSAGCRRVWQGGPPVFFPGAPWWVSPSVLPGWGVCPPLVEWMRGFAAVCLSLAPPPLFSFFPRLCCLFVSPFFGGGLPVPPSAFPGLVQALVVIWCG